MSKRNETKTLRRWKRCQALVTLTSSMNITKMRDNKPTLEKWRSRKSCIQLQRRQVSFATMIPKHTCGIRHIKVNLSLVFTWLCSIDAWRSLPLQSSTINGCLKVYNMTFMDVTHKLKSVTDLMSLGFWRQLHMIRKQMNLSFIHRNPKQRNGGPGSLED